MPFCEEIACAPRAHISSRYSGILPQSKDFLIKSTGYSKLPNGVKVSSISYWDVEFSAALVLIPSWDKLIGLHQKRQPMENLCQNQTCTHG